MVKSLLGRFCQKCLDEPGLISLQEAQTKLRLGDGTTKRPDRTVR